MTKAMQPKVNFFSEGWMIPAGYYLGRPATVRSFFHAGREKIPGAINPSEPGGVKRPPVCLARF